MNKKAYEQLSVSYIKQHFIKIMKYDLEKYFLTTDKTEIHLMQRKSRESIKIYEFEVRILTGILKKIVLIHNRTNI